MYLLKKIYNLSFRKFLIQKKFFKMLLDDLVHLLLVGFFISCENS